ncbi:MAG: peroxidase family protein [Pirellulales bacterium]
MAVMAVAPSPLPVQSLDGTGNNLAHPEWGSTVEQLLRKSVAAYADGVSAPAGTNRPSARLVSNLLAQSPAGGIVNDRDWTSFVYAWGQFLDHDLSLTGSAATERFSIAVPTRDAWFDPAGTGSMTISMSRSEWDATTGTGVGNPRQQLNEITAFIDGSQIYGIDAARAAALREFFGGRLKTSTGNLLPFNTAGLANANDAHRVADDKLFLAGDVRANENPELLALHTLFVREHNRIAAEAAAKNPTWTDEQLFQHARRIVIAELQKITYDEFLPALLGRPTPGADGIAAYRGYQATVNPGIATEFSTAAFRVGHSMLGEDIEFLANDGTAIRAPLPLRDAFFNPTPLSEVGIDGIVKYLASSQAQEIDTRVVDDVRNFLFGAPGQGGFDLAALNIQRGRDHGLADYNTVRVAYGLPRVTSFAQITPDTAVQQALQQAYGSVDRIDLWVGGLAEKHLPGSSLGATFTRIIVDQFTRLRAGDRYWYQNVLPADAVRKIQATTLADVIRRNTGVAGLQPGVFVLHAGTSVPQPPMPPKPPVGVPGLRPPASIPRATMFAALAVGLSPTASPTYTLAGAPKGITRR